MRNICALLSAGLSMTMAATSPATAQEAAARATDGNEQDVVVTARKRAETLQDVPMAVTALSSTDLDQRRVEDVNGLYAEVPGLFSAPGSVNNSADFA